MKLFAAAIDQSVSPGSTVWGTAALAGVANTAMAATTTHATAVETAASRPIGGFSGVCAPSTSAFEARDRVLLPVKGVMQALLTSPGPWKRRARAATSAFFRLVRRGFFRPRPRIAWLLYRQRGAEPAMEVEIGRGKKGRRAYGFDDIAIVPVAAHARPRRRRHHLDPGPVPLRAAAAGVRDGRRRQPEDRRRDRQARAGSRSSTSRASGRATRTPRSSLSEIAAAPPEVATQHDAGDLLASRSSRS